MPRHVQQTARDAKTATAATTIAFVSPIVKSVCIADYLRSFLYSCRRPCPRPFRRTRDFPSKDAGILPNLPPFRKREF
jgi:hypothetical protein